jgi:hypothetical protein
MALADDYSGTHSSAVVSGWEDGKFPEKNNDTNLSTAWIVIADYRSLIRASLFRWPMAQFSISPNYRIWQCKRK